MSAAFIFIIIIFVAQSWQQQQHLPPQPRSRHRSFPGADDNNSTSESGIWSSTDPTPAQANAMHNRRGGPTPTNDGRYQYRRGRGGAFTKQQPRFNNWSGGGSSGGNGVEGGGGGGDTAREHTGYLRMRGLPFNATAQDVMAFFETVKPIEDSIVFGYRWVGGGHGRFVLGCCSFETSPSFTVISYLSCYFTNHYIIFLQQRWPCDWWRLHKFRWCRWCHGCNGNESQNDGF